MLDPREFPVLIDNKDGAPGNALLGQKDSVLLSGCPAGLEIRQQRLLDTHFVGVSFV